MSCSLFRGTRLLALVGVVALVSSLTQSPSVVRSQEAAAEETKEPAGDTPADPATTDEPKVEEKAEVKTEEEAEKDEEKAKKNEKSDPAPTPPGKGVLKVRVRVENDNSSALGAVVDLIKANKILKTVETENVDGWAIATFEKLTDETYSVRVTIKPDPKQFGSKKRVETWNGKDPKKAPKKLAFTKVQGVEFNFGRFAARPFDAASLEK